MKPRLKKLKTLVLMQFQDKIDLSSRRNKKSVLFKVLNSVLGFAAITGLLYLLLYAGALLNVLSLSSTIPDYVISFLFSVMMLISIISCTVGLMNSFYFSADNPLLMTFPARPNDIFLSKLIVYYLLEIKRSFTFMLPIFIAFGLNNFGFSGHFAGFLLVALAAFPVIATIPVVTGAVLSIPAMAINMALRQFKLISFVIYLGLAAAFTVLIFYIVSKIPADFNLVRDFKNYYSATRSFLINFSRVFAPLSYVSRMVTGKTVILEHFLLPLSSFITFLVLIASLAAGTALVYIINRPLFFTMASKPFEYKKRVFESEKKNLVTNKFLSSVKKELLIIYRTPQLLFQNFFMLFTLPLAIFLMNKIFASMNTDLLGRFLSVCFNILMILLILTSGNTSAASLFSREGRAVYLLKTKPASLVGVTLAKLTLNLILSTISVLLTVIIMLRVGVLPVRDSVLTFFFAMFINVGHILWSAEMDIVNPKYEHFADGGIDTKNPNENKSVIYAFMLSFVFFGISLFLYVENAKVVWIKLTLLALAFLFTRICLFAARTKVYFREM